MLCRGPRKYPHTSAIMQIIFSFWSFEISEDILRIQNKLMVKIHLLNRSVYFYLNSVYINLCVNSPAKIYKQNYSFSNGSFRQLYRVTDEDSISETVVLPVFFFLNTITALKGTMF